ncbi:MAG TPA: hypothetical protein VJ975_05150 [Candidatus Limnocylindria bacterium]|nr:hypothetical protein [Candidatus Limnocylindria bacterium]
MRAGLYVAPDFEFRLLAALGNVEAWDGESERALTYMEEARSLADGITLQQRAAFLSGLALQYRRIGDFERAIRTGHESLALYRVTDARMEEAALEINLSLAFIQVGNLDRAAQHLGDAHTSAVDLHDARLDADIAEADAQLAFRRGNLDHARERANEAIAANGSGGSYLAAVGGHVTLARIARKDADRAEAERQYDRAVSLLNDHRARVRARDVLAEWADSRSDAGDHVGANKLYAAALGRGTGVSAER